MAFIPVATANGNIRPSRFVKIDTTTNNRALECGAGDKMIGISQKGTRRTPYGGLDDGFCAIAGEGFGVFENVETAPLYLDGAVTAGDRLKAGATGGGTPTTADGDFYGAIAPQSGLAGQIMEVQVCLGQTGA